MMPEINDKWTCYVGYGKAVAAVRRWCIRKGVIKHEEIL